MATSDLPPSGPAAVGSALPSGRFEGREAFRQRVRDALAAAASEGWTDIVLSDADFDGWPLGERAVIDSLDAWARSGRRFVMLARRYDGLQVGAPRFVKWRQTWDHIIECRRCATAGAGDLPSAIWTPSWVLQRVDTERERGFSGAEADRRLALRESIDEWLRRSSAGFPASTLGL